ncbi:MAG TPA: hypothetical protein VFT26_01275, partial [Pyrinomonadaceae bacterium]|nr:hypothetical protein [Pyrinomonadaceae bacterium]
VEEQPIYAIYPARKNLPTRTRSFLDFLGRRLKDMPRELLKVSMPMVGGDRPSAEAAPTLSLLYVAHLVSAAGFSDQRRAAGLDVTQSRVLIALAEYGELTTDALAAVIMLQRDVVEDTLRQLTNRDLLKSTGTGVVTLTDQGKVTQSSVQREWRLYEEKQLSRFSATDVATVRRFFGSYIRRFGPRRQEH